MKMVKKTLKSCAVLLAMVLLVSGITVFASGYSDDNSLADLGIENAVSVSPEFVYSTIEYEVVVPEGTEELILHPTTSHAAANYEVSGQVLKDGKTTVNITVTAESGAQAVYYLYVEAERPNAAAQIAAANETEALTEAPTEAPTAPETQVQTQPQTESASAAAGIVMNKVEELKSDTDFSMKVIYGLIAFSVLLLFIVINLILKNRDLKDDLRDAQEKLELQTNEFARKERFLATENYYAPVQQQAVRGRKKRVAQQEEPVQEQPQMAPQQVETAPVVEEAFGAVKKQLEEQEEQLASQVSQPVQLTEVQPQAQTTTEKEVQPPVTEAAQQQKLPPQHMAPKKKKNVDVTMVDL